MSDFNEILTSTSSTRTLDIQQLFKNSFSKTLKSTNPKFGALINHLEISLGKTNSVLEPNPAMKTSINFYRNKHSRYKLNVDEVFNTEKLPIEEKINRAKASICIGSNMKNLVFTPNKNRKENPLFQRTETNFFSKRRTQSISENILKTTSNIYPSSFQSRRSSQPKLNEKYKQLKKYIRTTIGSKNNFNMFNQLSDAKKFKKIQEPKDNLYFNNESKSDLVQKMKKVFPEYSRKTKTRNSFIDYKPVRSHTTTKISPRIEQLRTHLQNML